MMRLNLSKQIIKFSTVFVIVKYQHISTLLMVCHGNNVLYDKMAYFIIIVHSLPSEQNKSKVVERWLMGCIVNQLYIKF